MKTNIIRIACVVLIISFFIPLFTIPLVGMSISGLNRAAGMDVLGQHMDGTPLMFLLLILPIITLILSLVKKFDGIAGVISSIVCAILLIKDMSDSGQAGGIIQPGVGFYLSCIAYLAIIGVVIYDAVTKNSKAAASAPGSGS
jgi:hypothetical protein